MNTMTTTALRLRLTVKCIHYNKQIFPVHIFSYDTQEDANPDPLALVTSDGSVIWIPPAVIRSRCTRDDQEWVCGLIFRSMAYNGHVMDLDLCEDEEEVDLTYFDVSHWDVIGTSASRNLGYYSCCEEPYPELVFTLRLFSKSSASSSSTNSNYGNVGLFNGCGFQIAILTTHMVLHKMNI